MRKLIWIFVIALMGFGVIGQSTNLAKVEVTWEPPITTNLVLTGYVVYYGNINGTITNSVKIGNITNVTINNISWDVPYFFYVVAYDVQFIEGFPSEIVTNKFSYPTHALHKPSQVQDVKMEFRQR